TPDASSRAATPPPVAIFAVEQPQPIVRAQSADAPVVVAGDGEGLVDLASAGLLDSRRLILYSGSYATHPADLRALPADSVLVLTDSNRRRAQRGGLANVYGYTETAGEQPIAVDASDERIEVFPGQSDASRTVDTMPGIRSVQATTYGSIFGYTPAQRPAAAFDGDPKTAWLPSGLHGQRLVLSLTRPITTDHVTFVQPEGAASPYIKKLSLRFDGGARVHATLDRSSQSAGGQTVRFTGRRFSTLEIDIDSVHPGVGAGLLRPVGLSEVRVADDAPGALPVRAIETMRLPTDLLDALGASSARHPLVIAMASESTMDTLAMRRAFTLPTGRRFSISGSAVLSNLAVDRALGLPDARHGGVTATSSDQLDDPRARASNALDGDPTTAWNTPTDNVRGMQLRVEMPAVHTIDHLDLELTADGRHSIPTQIRVTGDNGSRLVALGKPPFAGPGGVDAVRVHFAPLRGRALSVTITDFEQLVGRDGGGFVGLPAGIAELGIPGVRRAPTPAQLPGTCLTGLLTIDGHPVSVRVTGSTDDALHRRPLPISACGATDTLTLGPGAHQLVSLRTAANPTGFDLQRLVVASAAGGLPAPAASLMTMPASDAGPAVTVTHQTRTSMTLRLTASSQPRWLVLGQSLNAGWHAKIDGHDLGAPRLVDGYANGWLVPSSLPGHAATVRLDWAPQRLVWFALWLSLAGGLACLTILGASLLRGRRRVTADVPGEDRAEFVGYAPIAARTVLLEAPLARETRRAVVAVATLAFVAAVVVRPWVGVLVGALAYLSTRDRRVRLLVRYAPAAIVAGIAAYMAGAQALHHYPTGTHWPALFAWARIPIWIALFLLLTDALVAWMWHRDDGPP
ncbi:MAG TPA: hypothetical protein VIK61_03730, partial [Acidimicrobiia bacterium]